MGRGGEGEKQTADAMTNGFDFLTFCFSFTSVSRLNGWVEWNNQLVMKSVGWMSGWVCTFT